MTIPRSRVVDALFVLAVLVTGIGEIWVPFDSRQGEGNLAVATVEVVVAAAALWWQGEREKSATRLRDGLGRFPDSTRLRETQMELERLETRWRERVGARVAIVPAAVMHYDLGLAWARRGFPAAAAAHFKQAFILAPSFAEAATALDSTRSEGDKIFPKTNTSP